jgi:centrin-3
MPRLLCAITPHSPPHTHTHAPSALRARPVTDKYLARDPEAEMRKAFALFDEDNTGCISLKNLKKVARELGEEIPDAELEAMIEEFDTRGDGTISEQDFLSILRQAQQ